MFILIYLDLKKVIILKTDILYFLFAEILLQYLKNDIILQLIAYFNKKHIVIKCNYKIYNKKLLIIIYYFENYLS